MALYNSAPGVWDGPRAGLGWLGLVEIDVDRPRSRATDGHSVNDTRKTKNHAVARHKRNFIRPDEGQSHHGRAPWVWERQHTSTKWRCTKNDDNITTRKVTPLLAEPACCAVSLSLCTDHLYLGRLPAGRGARSLCWMISRHGARSPARRAPCRRSRTT